MGRAAAGTDLPIQRRGEIGMEGFPQPARQSSLLGRSDRPRFRPTGLGSAAVAMATGENPDRPRSRAVAHAHTNTHTHTQLRPNRRLHPSPPKNRRKRDWKQESCVCIYMYIYGEISCGGEPPSPSCFGIPPPRADRSVFGPNRRHHHNHHRQQQSQSVFVFLPRMSAPWFLSFTDAPASTVPDKCRLVELINTYIKKRYLFGHRALQNRPFDQSNYVSMSPFITRNGRTPCH